MQRSCETLNRERVGVILPEFKNVFLSSRKRNSVRCVFEIVKLLKTRRRENDPVKT